MSEAKKCDRCGNYYDGDVAYPVVDLIDGRSKQITIIGSACYGGDLCQSCWNNFELWWNEVNKETDTVEQSMDEWCTDCKEYDHEKNCCPRFNRVIRETLKDLEQVKGGEEE